MDLQKEDNLILGYKKKYYRGIILPMITVLGGKITN